MSGVSFAIKCFTTALSGTNSGLSIWRQPATAAEVDFLRKHFHLVKLFLNIVLGDSPPRSSQVKENRGCAVHVVSIKHFSVRLPVTDEVSDQVHGKQSV
jgi:hypothetical protein